MRKEKAKQEHDETILRAIKVLLAANPHSQVLAHSNSFYDNYNFSTLESP